MQHGAAEARSASAQHAATRGDDLAERVECVAATALPCLGYRSKEFPTDAAFVTQSKLRVALPEALRDAAAVLSTRRWDAGPAFFMETNHGRCRTASRSRAGFRPAGAPVAPRARPVENRNARAGAAHFAWARLRPDKTALGAPTLTLSRQLADDAGFQNWLKAAKTPTSAYAVELRLPPLQRKAGPISGISPVEHVPLIYVPPPFPLRLVTLLPQLMVGSGTIEYLMETSFTPGAAVVPETTLKPTTTLATSRSSRRSRPSPAY